MLSVSLLFWNSFFNAMKLNIEANLSSSHESTFQLKWRSFKSDSFIQFFLWFSLHDLQNTRTSKEIHSYYRYAELHTDYYQTVRALLSFYCECDAQLIDSSVVLILHIFFILAHDTVINYSIIFTVLLFQSIYQDSHLFYMKITIYSECSWQNIWTLRH